MIESAPDPELTSTRFFNPVLAAALCIVVTAAVPSSAVEGVLALPGSVVIWSGGNPDQCSVSGKSWAAVDGACWYPIDLMQPEGLIVLGRSGSEGTELLEITVGPYPYSVQHLTVAPKMVDLSEEDLLRSQKESAKMKEVFRRRGAAVFSFPLGPPLRELPKGRNFGSKRVFNDQPRSPHKGVDYSAVVGTEVISVERGLVVLAEDLFFGGNSVFVDHGGGMISMYLHLNTFEVKEGQELERGQRLGTVGTTGRVTGPHLHFGIRWLGATVDPTVLLGDTKRLVKIGR